MIRKGGGGLQINETLRQFPVKSGQTITAGTFVDIETLTGFGTSVTLGGGTSSQNLQMAKLTDTSYIYLSTNSVNSPFNTGCNIVTVSGNTTTVGARQNFLSNGVNGGLSVTALTSTTFVVATVADSTAFLRAATISGGTITYGTAVQVGPTGGSGSCVVEQISSTTFLVIYNETTPSILGKVRVGTVSGTTITLGTAINYNNTSLALTSSARRITKMTNTTYLISFMDGTSGSQFPTFVVATVSGTTVSVGSKVNLETTGASINQVTRLTDTTFLIGYIFNTQARVRIGTVSGTTVSFGTRVDGRSSIISDRQILRPIKSDNSLWFLMLQRSTSPFDAFYYISTLSGTTFTIGSEVSYSSNNVSPNDAILMTDGILSLLLQDSQNPNGRVYSDSQSVINTTSQQVRGLSKTGGTGGQIIDVFTNF